MKPQPMLRVLRLTLPFWRGMALAALFGVLTIASSISLMATSAWLISKAALQPSIAELSVAVVGVRFFGIARGGFRYLERVAAHETTFRLLAHLRVTFYQALEPLAPARLVTLKTGDLLSRVITDVESLQNLFLRAAAPPLIALVIALLLTVFLYAFDPMIALSVLVFMLAAGVLLPAWTWWNSQKTGKGHVLTQGQLKAALVDNIQGMAETLVYGQAAVQMTHIQMVSQRYAAEDQRLARLEGVQAGVSVFLTSAAALAALIAAIPRVEGIYLATVTLATTAAFEAFMPLMQAALQLGANVQAAQRLFQIVDLSPAVTDPALPAVLPDNTQLDLRGVAFRYSSDTPTIFDQLTFSLQPGQRVAILGESGSGKSTLGSLLLRFWDYEQGQILLGGRDLREYSQADVRRSFGVMSQRTYLFNTTIRANIRLARPDATSAEVEEAARQAQIHEFIMSLPEGYDTVAAEDGTNLSGGQRQRIALARVLLTQAPILILDEATANLDPVTERAVMETILRETAGRSLLVFTHRRTLLNKMDAVYRIQQGKLSLVQGR